MNEITNELIHERVMGECVHPKAEQRLAHFDGIQDFYCRICSRRVPYQFEVPDYLHSLDAAGLVLDRLRERYYIQLRVEVQGQWRVTCDELPLRPGAGFADEWADTLPEAICRAALALAEQDAQR